MKDATYAVSVIIPVYNTANYIRECLRSVFNQTISAIEIICIDDCSTDESYSIVKEFAEQDKRIRLFRNENNRGLSVTRNVAISNAKGKYIFFLDSDDLIRKDTLEILLESAEDYNADIVQFDYHHLFEEGVDVWYRSPKANYHGMNGVYNGKDFFAELALNRVFEAQACIRLFRRKLIQDNNISFYGGILHEDYLFSFLSFMHAKRVVCCDEDLYTYRKRASGITNRTDVLRSQSYFMVFCEVFSYWRNNSFSDEVSKAINVLVRDLFYMFVRYEDAMESKESFPFGTVADKWLYTTMVNYTLPAYEYITLYDDFVNTISEEKEIYIYGAGNYGKELYNKLVALDIYVKGFLVSDSSQSGKLCLGRRIIAIDEYNRGQKGLVIVAVSPKIEREIVDMLEEKDCRYMLLHE